MTRRTSNASRHLPTCSQKLTCGYRASTTFACRKDPGVRISPSGRASRSGVGPTSPVRSGAVAERLAVRPPPLLRCRRRLCRDHGEGGLRGASRQVASPCHQFSIETSSSVSPSSITPTLLQDHEHRLAVLEHGHACGVGCSEPACARRVSLSVASWLCMYTHCPRLPEVAMSKRGKISGTMEPARP